MKGKLLMFIIFLAINSIVSATEFRPFTPIATPEGKKISEVTSPLELSTIDKTILDKAIQDFIDSWNNSEIDKILDSEFFDKNRLLESMSGKMQKDARLKVLSIQDVQILNESTKQGPSGETLIVYTISTTLNTQIEFNDPKLGFQRVNGKNQVVFDITIKPEEKK